MDDLLVIYKKELEMYLATLSIFVGDKIVNIDQKLNEENRQFIKKKFFQLKANNVDEAVLDLALDELLPYLYEKK